MSLHKYIQYNAGQTIDDAFERQRRIDELNRQAAEDYKSAIRSWMLVAGILTVAIFYDYSKRK